MQLETSVRKSLFEGPHGLCLAADVGGSPLALPVVLLHGGGQTRSCWGRAPASLIEAGYRVVSMDMRGHGESDWAPDHDYSIDAFIADLESVLATLTIPPVLIGASLGGITSLLYMGEHDPPFASGLVLVDVVPRIDVGGAAHIAQFMRGTTGGFATLEEAGDAVAAYLPHRPRPSDLSGLSRNLRPAPEGRLRWHWDPHFISGGTRIDPFKLRDRMECAARAVRQPTLLVRGGESEIVTPEGAESLRSLMPSAEFVDVEGARHMVAGDSNEMFAGAVLGFLRKHFPVSTTRLPAAL